eukprot:snap_masked-scaffold_9-processed-gene-2.42-mRNA-1 protein AED:0.39 eAED:0.39 QI:0/-1/0/1/-1/1/1/0/263
MGERKVLNKYYPPNFDPSKVPRRKMAFNAPVGIRMMLPFNMCCLSCGHYMYQGKKFNSKKETALGMDYLGIERLRFIIKCELCNNRITFLTDPKNQDYECESGATRNYSAWQDERAKALKKIKQSEKDAKDNEEKDGETATNYASVRDLERKTLENKKEMNNIENLQKMKTFRSKVGSVDLGKFIQQRTKSKRKLEEQIDAQEIEEFNKRKKTIKKQHTGVHQPSDKPDMKTGKGYSGVLKVRKKKKKPKKISLVGYGSSSSD